MNEPLTLEQAAARLREVGARTQKVSDDIEATRKYLADLEEQAQKAQSDWSNAVYRLTLAAGSPDAFAPSRDETATQ